MSRKSRKRPVRPQIFFFVEGETEEAFFQALAQRYRLTAVTTTKILKNSGVDWVDKTKNMLAHNKRFRADSSTKIFIIFDKNNSTQNDVVNMCKKANELSKEVAVCKIGFSNNSFEVWLLAHYEKINSGLRSSKRLYHDLSKYLGQEYEKANRIQIQKILEDNKVFEAISNTKSVAKISVDSQSTNIGTMIESVLQQ